MGATAIGWPQNIDDRTSTLTDGNNQNACMHATSKSKDPGSKCVRASVRPVCVWVAIYFLIQKFN